MGHFRPDLILLVPGVLGAGYAQLKLSVIELHLCTGE